MENIGENQGTSRKIKRFFLDVSVLTASLDALKRLGKKGGLERLARRGERRGNSEIIRKAKTREERGMDKPGEMGKDRPANERSFQKQTTTARRRNREENDVDERLLTA